MTDAVLITGAGRRLGKALAGYFLAGGYRVVAHYNTVCELAEHPQLTCLQADLTDAEAVQALCQQLPAHGPFRAVIHNASCFIPDAAANDLATHFQHHLMVHVTAPGLITAALDNHWGSDAAMVCISDIYADIPNQRFSAYCAAKAGLQNWAISMAQRLAGQVRVNVVQPGPVQFLPEHDEAYRRKVLSQSLIGRELGYEAVIEACDYLLKAGAVTGTVMRVDGGRFVANRYDQTFTS